jgi:cytochrome oxidase Cu insertion factor (SCO1/SenC/PrrC family)
VVLAIIAGMYAYKKLNRTPVVRTEASFEPRTLDLSKFELTERSGRKFKFDELEGKVWVASFFFSNCPSLCLRLNHRISDLEKDLAGSDVRFISISVDPENDTPERLAEYAGRFKADPNRWLFLTPKQADVAAIAEAFAVSGGAESDPSSGHTNITHSDRLMLVDRTGKLHRPVSSSSEPELSAMVKKAKKLAAEEPR